MKPVHKTKMRVSTRPNAGVSQTTTTEHTSPEKNAQQKRSLVEVEEVDEAPDEHSQHGEDVECEHEQEQEPQQVQRRLIQVVLLWKKSDQIMWAEFEGAKDCFVQVSVQKNWRWYSQWANRTKKSLQQSPLWCKITSACVSPIWEGIRPFRILASGRLVNMFPALIYLVWNHVSCSCSLCSLHLLGVQQDRISRTISQKMMRQSQTMSTVVWLVRKSSSRTDTFTPRKIATTETTGWANCTKKTINLGERCSRKGNRVAVS